MHDNSELEYFLKNISSAYLRKKYFELETFAQDIFSHKDKLLLLSDLSNRLTGLPFEALFLRGLPFLIKMSDEEYRELYRLCNKKDIAIYRLTRFLIAHGRADKQTLQRLCFDYNEIDKIEQVRLFFESNDAPSTDERKMNKLTYRDQEIPAENIAAFRSRLSQKK